MTTIHTRAASVRLVALAVLTAAACSGDGVNGPRDASFDAPLARTQMQSIDALLAAGPLESFSAMGPHFGLQPAAMVVVSDANELARARTSLSPADARNLAASSAERVWTAASVHTAAVPVLPPQMTGTTYIWNVAERRYVAAPGRTGAPSNGLRFILYAVNPLTKEPVVASEIGYADLTDIGVARASGIGLRLQVVSGATTFLDYTMNAEGTETSGAVSVDGFLTDGAARLNFEIDARGTTGPNGRKDEVDFKLEVAERDFAANGTVRGLTVGGAQSHQVDLAVRVREANVRFAVVGDANTMNASVFVNEHLFATVTGDPRQPVVRGAGGRELRPDEAQALGHMVGLADVVFHMLDGLLKPIDSLLGQN